MADIIAERCVICGEIIPRPELRKDGRIVCTDCWGDSPSRALGKKSYPADSADIQYHGGRFNAGEW